MKKDEKDLIVTNRACDEATAATVDAKSTIAAQNAKINFLTKQQLLRLGASMYFYLKRKS
eukprot:1877802-Ditylum_brightwellii.AAC.2